MNIFEVLNGRVIVYSNANKKIFATWDYNWIIQFWTISSSIHTDTFNGYCSITLEEEPSSYEEARKMVSRLAEQAFAYND